MAGVTVPPSVKQMFVKEYMNTLWQKFAFFRLLHKVRRIKLAGLWEANLDKVYLETQFPNQVNYDEADDRKALADEKHKPEDKQNAQKIEELENKIALGKAIRNNYRKNESFRNETRSYVQMLDLWLKGK
jgi:hypothetical protein